MDIPTPTNYLPNPIYSKSSQFEYSYILMTPDFFLSLYSKVNLLVGIVLLVEKMVSKSIKISTDDPNSPTFLLFYKSIVNFDIFSRPSILN